MSVRQRLAASAATPVRTGPVPVPDRPMTSRRLPPALAARLSRAYGNRDVQRIVQNKLRVGPAGDHHEREADRIAAEISGGSSGGAPVQAHAPGAEGGLVAPGLQQDIQRARGHGQPLPEHVRAPVEQALGADFTHVRLHTDSEADRLSRSLEAQAFTTGRDIFLRRGQAGPASPAGRELIAHELTHVTQQAGSGGTGEGVIQRKLWQVSLGPDRVYDDVLNIFATRDVTVQHVFVGDSDGLDYEIVTDSSGNPALAQAASTFRIHAAPSTWTLAGTQGFSAPPVWNPGPVDQYWQSPGGTTTFSHSPGGTAYAPGATQQGPYGTKSRRAAAGYVNPDQFAVKMLPLWQAAVRPVGSAPPPTARTAKAKKTWYADPTRQFEVTGLGGAPMQVTGYQKPGTTTSAFVLGHSIDAADLFNIGGHGQPTGHTVPRGTNEVFNKGITPYHGLEHWTYSSASGGATARYQSPRPDRGSDRTYWDPNATGYTGGPWHQYDQITPLVMIKYIDGKLAGVPHAQRDGDYAVAMVELGKLKQAFTQGHADGLLSWIKTKGW